MFTKQQQEIFELMNHEGNNYIWLREYEDTLVEQPLEFVNQWLNRPHEMFKEDGSVREDNVEIIQTLLKQDHRQNLFRMLAMILTNKTSVTAQQLVGHMFNKFSDIKIYQRRLRVIEVYLLAIEKSPLVKYRKQGDHHLYASVIELNKETQDKLKDQGYPLPLLIPPVTHHNNSIGYITTDEHIISGCHVKRHNEKVALDHINRLNAVACKVETRVGFLSEPHFDFMPKFNKKTCAMETAQEVQERYKAHLQLVAELPKKIDTLVSKGNTFYFAHRYDSRLRTYRKAYHFNTLGHKYCKAIVQLKGGAIAEGVDKYISQTGQNND